MSEFEKQWNVAMALDILGNETVDSELWAEAVKWLMLYGPPGIKQLLGGAAGTATNSCFPGLRARRFTRDGQPCYDIRELAEALEISEEEARAKIANLEEEHGGQQIFAPVDTHEIQ